MTESAMTRPSAAAWLVLAYRLPAKSSLKTTIRRRLTAMGAVFPASAVAVLPGSPAAGRAFRRLRSTIGQAGGSAQVLRAEAIEGGRDLIAAFNAARDREYEQVIAGCAAVAAGIQALTAARCFRHQDLAGKEAELKRLSARSHTIGAQDAFHAARAGAAASSLARCHAALDEFATRIYEADTCPAEAAPRPTAARICGRQPPTPE